MQPRQHNLFEAFREDHAILGKGFHDLSQALRVGDTAAAVQVAGRLNATAGAHIAFEEEHFYPALAPLLGAREVERMSDEHRGGLEVVRALLHLGHEAPPDPQLRQQLLQQSQAMESHVAECGELFGAMGRIPLEEQAALHEALQEWRRKRPRWTDYADAHAS